MKKQEIKRRKRVVPTGDGGLQAAPSVADYSPQQRPSQTPAFEHSVSPDPSTALESREEYTPEPPRGPIAVDFTHYYSNPSAPSNPAAFVPNMQPSAPSPRKRSRSATIDPEEADAHQGPHRPNAISSILNPSQVADATIDLSLSVPLRPSARTSPHPGMSQEEKATRRERLQREAEAIRQELERRQKELDDLEND
jgi:GATA-binding protein